MNIEIRARNVEITAALEEHITRKSVAEDAVEVEAATNAAARLGELMVSVVERHRTSRASLRYATSVTAPLRGMAR